MLAFERARNGVIALALGGALVQACGDSDDPLGSSGGVDASHQDGSRGEGDALDEADGSTGGNGTSGDGDANFSGDGDIPGDGDGGGGGDGDGAGDGGGLLLDGGDDLDANPGTGGDGDADVVESDGGNDAAADGGNQCSTISSEVADHVEAVATAGWAAVNVSNALLMHGCAGAATTLDCLSTYPRANSTLFGATWESDLPTAKLRILRTNNYSSSYWTRSSPDGRFVAHGGSSTGATATFIDLDTSTTIGAAALYDPGFFPDSSGFLMHGSGPKEVCLQSVLTAAVSSITFNESGCATASTVGLNQHLAAGLSNGRHWAVSGPFESDNGGIGTTLSDPPASFPASAAVELVPLVNNGTTFTLESQIQIPLPYQGDVVISPSATLLVSRVSSPSDVQDGYRLHKLELTPENTTFTAETSEIAHYCVRGGVPSFSYDERWVVLHHYVEAEDAEDIGFSADDDAGAQYLSQGAANIYLLELATGELTRITRMNPGQYAVFPHFRSDGWIYFMVRTVGSSTEYLVASDAALVLGQ